VLLFFVLLCRPRATRGRPSGSPSPSLSPLGGRAATQRQRHPRHTQKDARASLYSKTKKHKFPTYAPPQAFQGRHGRAYLFNDAVNVTLGPPEDRMLITGLHTVADIFCTCCNTNLGWKYEQAYEDSQKYKEGKYIIEKARVMKVCERERACVRGGLAAAAATSARALDSVLLRRARALSTRFC
jgi:hypothetical protein